MDHMQVLNIGTVLPFALLFFFSSRRRHTRYIGDWSSDVCSSDTVWVGDFDSNQLYLTANHGVNSFTYPSDVRAEGMVYDPGSKTLWVITPFPGDHKLYELTTTRSEERRVGKEWRCRCGA